MLLVDGARCLTSFLFELGFGRQCFKEVRGDLEGDQCCLGSERRLSFSFQSIGERCLNL